MFVLSVMGTVFEPGSVAVPMTTLLLSVSWTRLIPAQVPAASVTVAAVTVSVPLLVWSVKASTSVATAPGARGQVGQVGLVPSAIVVTGGRSAMLIRPWSDEKPSVADVGPYVPARSFEPVATVKPPPPLAVVLLSCHLVTLDRSEFVKLPGICAELMSDPFETIATTRVAGTPVVAPGIETAVVVDGVTSPAVTSQGLPDVVTPLNVMICAT